MELWIGLVLFKSRPNNFIYLFIIEISQAIREAGFEVSQQVLDMYYQKYNAGKVLSLLPHSSLVLTS